MSNFGGKDMKNLKKGVALLAGLVLLGACTTYDLDGVKMMETQGSAFNKALHGEYVRLAGMERDETDWSDAGFFNEKARSAGMGTKVGPQEMSGRSLPEDKVNELSFARVNLVKALGAGMDSNPAAAARAQAGFDCWMQEQEENFQPKDIEACKKYYMAAMKELSGKKPAMKKKKVPGPFTVYFNLGSAELTDEGFAVVANAYDKLRWAKLTGANIQAHTDTSGSNLLNAKLSAARMDAVAKLLQEFGLSAANISKAAFGENKPAVKTADGVVEAKNRRVVITLN